MDFGEGQKPEDFPKTFLSLSEKNKEGIPFVQGKFNMGSTGSLRFCTQSNIMLGHYKLIVSKRPDAEYWGWTLVRVRGPKAGEQLPVAEYFCPGGSIPRFRDEKLSALGDDTFGQVAAGTIVKLYEYDIGKGNSGVDFGLRDALDVNLIDCALPIRTYDFDAKPQETKGPLRARGVAASTFSGLSVSVGASESPEIEESNIDEGENQQANEGSWTHHVITENHEHLGRIKVLAIGIKKMKESLASRQSARVFYTVNGQTQACERASFLNGKANYGDLRNHLLVNVICDDMDKRAMASIFMPDRERKANIGLARSLENLVIDALQHDEKLRAFANEIRLSRAKEYTAEKEESADLLKELAKADPALKELFGLGVLIPVTSKTPGGLKPWDEGKKFPTFLEPLNLKKEDGKYVKEVPVKGYRRIECGTDAEDGYLSRKDSPGQSWGSLESKDLPWKVPPLAAGEAHPEIKNHRARALSDLNLKRISCAEPGQTNQYLRTTRYGDLSLGCHNRLKARSGSESFTDTYTRMKGDDLAPTITTRCVSITNGRFGHYDTSQNRGITPREAALLQTFPVDYAFPEDNLEFSAILIGNAVPPRLARFFGGYLKDRIKT